MSFLHLNIYLIFSFLIFFLSFINFFKNLHNTILLLLNFEIMLLSVNFIFISYGLYFNTIMGQIIVLFILTAAATEVAIGIALLLLFLRLSGNIIINSLFCSKT